jgi:hypothetical protein
MKVLRLVPWLFAVTLVVGAATLLRFDRLVDAGRTPAVVERIREVARLEVLEVSVHRKVTFEPQPPAHATLMGDVWEWAREAVSPRRGRAVVFAEGRWFVDLRKLRAQDVRVEGDSVTLVMPEPEVEAVVMPGETEVIASNLDSAQTAALLEAAQGQLKEAVEQDPALRLRAREAAERSVAGLLKALGFKSVSFASRLGTNFVGS